MSTITIRPALPDDADAIVRILGQTYEATWKPVLTPAAIARFESSGSTLRYVDERICAMHVAMSGAEIAGVIDWSRDFIDALHVSPRYQGQGIGGQLLRYAEAAMVAAGHAQSRLETDTFNLQARGFYGSHGYQETGFCPDEEWHSGLTTVQMAKQLTSA
ncbi:GNAT family N-acetyltransferase [Comamonas testosteroni]